MSQQPPDEEFERRLRDVFRSRGLGLPVSPDALDRIHSGARRRQQRRTATSVTAAFLVVVITGVGIAINSVVHDRGDRNVAAAQTSQAASTRSGIAPSTPAVTVSASPSTSPSTPTAASSPTSSAVAVTPADSSAASTFEPFSVTAVGPTTYWVLLGGMPCHCTVVKMTSDGGQTFTTLPGPAGVGAKGWRATSIRFANAKD